MSDDRRERRRADYPVSRPMALRWADIDTYGHVNNAINYLLMDTLINGWLGEQTGVDIRSELPGFAVVVETGCAFFREMHFDSPLVLGLRLEKVSRSSVHYEIGFFIDGDAPAAVGRFVHVYIDPISRSPVSVPDAVRTVLRSIETPKA